ncbi:MAG: porin [Epsilonproteobacteria bacterium]|nr:MAG: porin [Campylobacterota bacterium]
MRFKYVLTCLFSPVFIVAESSIVEAFENASLHSQIKFFSYTIEKETGEDAYANAIGGYLKYSTDTKQILYATIQFHTSQAIGYNHNPEDTALFKDNGEALTANSEAYIGWNGTDRVLKVGNLMLDTPMINDDRTRIVPWSYQGMAYTGKAFPDTKVQLYHISQIRSYTSDTYTKESASGQIGSGITMLGLHYYGLNNIALKSFYYYAPDLYSTFIVQANYKLIFNNEDLFCLNMQYFNSGNAGKYADTENKNGGDDIDLLAVKIGYDAEDWRTSLSYSQNFGISGIVKGYGGLSKVFTTSMIANGRGNYKPETWMLKTEYDFPYGKWGQSEMAFTYTNTRTKDSRGDDFDAYYLHWRHQFKIDASLYVRYENLEYKNDKSDANYLRIIASYRF